MSDVRALLKAKRQELRIDHPLAFYTPSGQLRCLACNTSVKHTSSWDGHVGSKAHRVNAARLRQEEEEKAMVEERKRKVAETRGDHGDDDVEDEHSNTKKRKTSSEPSVTQVASTTVSSGAFPTDFFSDPSQAPPPPSSDEEYEDEVDSHVTSTLPPGPASIIDSEWEQFQQAVLKSPDAREAYDRATVIAEPVLTTNGPEGFPLSSQDDGAEEPEQQMSVEQMRIKKEEEERELIMDRLLDEERAQEEADAKVTMLKNRRETLRKQREVRRAQKAKANNV